MVRSIAVGAVLAAAAGLGIGNTLMGVAVGDVIGAAVGWLFRVASRR